MVKTLRILFLLWYDFEGNRVLKRVMYRIGGMLKTFFCNGIVKMEPRDLFAATAFLKSFHHSVFPPKLVAVVQILPDGVHGRKGGSQRLQV